ncbi:MAG: hypothetical protein EBS00_00685 [Verrucomicrobia bacterium]|nr:hypothetical protein [Verrucomicrobiota bacterium]
MIRAMLIGRKGVGKNTIASIIQNRRPEVQLGAFADALKKDVAMMLNHSLSISKLPGKTLPMDVDALDAYRNLLRPIWQWYGTEWGRARDNDVWIRRFHDERGFAQNMIITDCRFQNEADYGKRNGYVLVRVTGPNWREPSPLGEDVHASEQELLDISAAITISNEGSLAMLTELVHGMLIPYIEKNSFEGSW